MEVPEWFVEPSFARRLAARVVDNLLFAPMVLLRFVVDDVSFLLLGALVRAAYEVTFVARDGQTLGKRWLGLRVVDRDTGAVPTLNQAALRYAVPETVTLLQLTAPGLSPLLGLVIYLPILKGPLHRGLHDHAAGTVVTACRT